MSLLLAVLLAVIPVRAQDEDVTRFMPVPVKAGDTLWSIAERHLKDPQLWPELIKYNKLPSSDPTVALPGMTLRVPVAILRIPATALLVYLNNRVLYRPHGTADWRDAQLAMKLRPDDGVRTAEAAHARIRFATGRELFLEPDSLAIIGPPTETARDAVLELKAGALKAVRVTIRTHSARVVPKDKDTSYNAEIKPDLSTEVQVFSGAAEVEGAGRSVEVPSGFSVNVPTGAGPSVPRRIAEMPAAPAPAAAAAPKRVETARLATDSGEVKLDLQSLRVGVPISGYRVQALETEDFRLILFDHTFDADERIELRTAPLEPGQYWFRIAPIDLLGVPGGYSKPRLVGVGR